MRNRTDEVTQSKRWASLDHFRGLAIFLMILINSLAEYNVPAWLKHTTWNGYTFADLIAPMFLFAMGTAYRISLRKRLALYGLRSTIFHFIKRYAILFLFGLVGSLLMYKRFDWGVLQMLGAVGIFSLPMIFLKPLMSLSISCTLLLIYQFSISFFNMKPIVSAFDMGGPFATLSWSFTLITASVLGGWMKGKESRQVKGILIPIGVIVTLSGLLLSIIFPLNKHLVSSSYIIFSLGISLLIFIILYILMDIHGVRIRYLESLGKNPLVLYIIGSVLVVLQNAIIKSTIPLIFPLLSTLVILIICIVLAEILTTRKVYIKL